MGAVFHTHEVTLNAPDDSGPYEVTLYVEWDRISKAVPARINYDENDSPAEPAEWEVKGVELK